MNRETELARVRSLLFLVNLSVLLYYSAVRLATTFRVCRTFSAYAFLSSVRRMPPYPWRMPLLALGLYGALVLVSEVRSLHADGRLWPCAAEIGLCVGAAAALDFYYSGLALLVLADLISDVRGRWARLAIIASLSLVYAFGRYEILYPLTSGIPFSAYLDYYSPTVRGYLTGIGNGLLCLNALVFVYDMILLFTSQREENVRISRLNRQLHHANHQLRRYAVELERLTEIRERNRLAREIHDTLGHALTGIIMGADACMMLFDAAPEEARKRISVIAQTAREGLNDVRRSIKALRPDALEQHSLEEALESMIANFHLSTSADIRFEQLAGPLRFAGDEEDTLYRIIQEGMTNAVRHGHATEITVRVTRRDDLLTIDVRDNGLGCENPEEGFGLRHMRERLDLLGGSMTCGNRDLDSDDGRRGFFLAASLPVRGQE